MARRRVIKITDLHVDLFHVLREFLGKDLNNLLKSSSLLYRLLAHDFYYWQFNKDASAAVFRMLITPYHIRHQFDRTRVREERDDTNYQQIKMPEKLRNTSVTVILRRMKKKKKEETTP
mgnify:CR=1 FL=1